LALVDLPRKWLLLSAAGLALVVTPYLACSSSESENVASFSEADADAKLLGTWQGTAEIEGESIPFSLMLERAPWQRLTPGHLAVAGTLTSEHPALNGTVDGAFDSHGDHAALLALRLDNGKTLHGTLEGDALSDGRIDNTAHAGTFGLTRP
jgi:hypothetical protein